MKTRVFALNLLLAATTVAKAQHATFDFPSWSVYNKITPVKHGTMASLKIININTLLYKVSIKGEKVVSTTPSSSELNTLFRIEDPAKAASEASEGSGEGAKATEEMTQVKNKADAGNFKALMTDLIVSCKAYLMEADKIVEIKSRRAELTALAKFPWEKYALLAEKLPKVPLVDSDMRRDINNFQKTYQTAEAKYKVARETAPDDVSKKIVDDALDLFETSYDHIDEEDLMKLVDDVVALQNALATDFFFTVWGPPVQADDCDFIKYSIVVERDPETSRLLPAGSFQPIDVEIPVKGGWKADFSVGLNFAVGNGAKDAKYHYADVSDGEGKLEKADNYNKVRPGIAAMMHAYPRTGKNHAVGFMMGVGAGFKEENTLVASYYLGGSIVLGKSQRIIINSGVSFISVDRLKPEYQEGASYKTETKLAEITEKAIRPAFFIGVSYNIANRIIKK
ncbi:hypothetical protein [Dyadobacter sp. CY323]|uniref:hypothetical protein n=1 Tax=Dyadobacter sp. CY323 TaxID=2907302 RepID=UPI001F26FCFA|nr:hypothetical protein [Dyadobacter sp. CY323]MCE6989806.1 hypothetical protein [Dyadobacter sp. CY323]